MGLAPAVPAVVAMKGPMKKKKVAITIDDDDVDHVDDADDGHDDRPAPHPSAEHPEIWVQLGRLVAPAGAERLRRRRRHDDLDGDGGEFVEQGFLRASAGLGCGRLLEFRVALWPARCMLRDSSSRQRLGRSDRNQEHFLEARGLYLCDLKTTGLTRINLLVAVCARRKHARPR